MRRFRSLAAVSLFASAVLPVAAQTPRTKPVADAEVASITRDAILIDTHDDVTSKTVTGYNIAYSMGIKFDRILDAFDGPFEKLPDLVTPAAGRVTQAPGGGGYLLSHQVNDAFVAVNRLLKANEDVKGHARTREEFCFRQLQSRRL